MREKEKQQIEFSMVRSVPYCTLGPIMDGARDAVILAACHHHHCRLPLSPLQTPYFRKLLVN